VITVCAGPVAAFPGQPKAFPVRQALRRGGPTGRCDRGRARAPTPL